MEVEVLISTMNLDDNNKLIKKMNINGKSLTINQITNKNIKSHNDTNSINKILSFNEKGLSKSRNKALKNSSADICVIADDDLKYKSDYDKIIQKAYKKHKDADIIAFNVENCKTNNKYNEKKVNFLKSFKICSVQVTFKRDKIIKNNICFDEFFGAGSNKFILGEENIFLTDCIKKGLKIYYVSETIAKLENSESTWFSGYNEIYFKSKGACFYRINKLFSYLFILQFSIRKYKKYKEDMSFVNSIKFMLKGIKEYKKEVKNHGKSER